MPYLQQEDSLCHYTSAQTPKGVVLVTLWQELEQESASGPELDLDTQSLAAATRTKDSVCVCRGIPGSGHTLRVGFHSFLFQTFALAAECQTWSWYYPLCPPCLCTGHTPEEGETGAVAPLGWLWNVGLMHKPF